MTMIAIIMIVIIMTGMRHRIVTMVIATAIPIIAIMTIEIGMTATVEKKKGRSAKPALLSFGAYLPPPR